MSVDGTYTVKGAVNAKLNDFVPLQDIVRSCKVGLGRSVVGEDLEQRWHIR